MTDQQAKFLEVCKRFEKVKNDLKLLSDELDLAMSTLEVGSYFQDPATLAVYHITKPSGTFVTFKQVSYERTKLEGEAKGSLSIKEAESKGFYFGK